MFRPVVLFAALGLLVGSAVVPGNISTNDSCSVSGLIDNCDISNPGDGVDIGGDNTHPGGGGGPGGGSGPGGGGGGGGTVPIVDGPGAPAPEDPGLEPPQGCQPNEVAGVWCVGPEEPDDEEEDEGGDEGPRIPPVTVSDLIHFTPDAPSLSGEPAGIAVVGMPMNVVTAAQEHSLTGRLFDLDVTVWFRPVSYVISYGDGTSRTVDGPGASWDSLGQADFTPTSTGHVYDARGKYTVSVTVRYVAAVDFGPYGWRPVPGYVEATTGGYQVRVVEVRTGLVDRTCLENPRGPGC